MAAPFTVTSVSNYNANPPSDDGAQNTSNQVKWATIKAKLPDPIKAAFDTSESSTSTAFGKIPGGAGITTTAVNYGAGASDQGKLLKVTAAGVVVTTPDATAVSAPFLWRVLNNSSGDITIDGNGTQTVDGDLTFTVPSGCGVVIDTDGSNWFTNGRDFNNQLGKPQGYLTPSSGNKVITSDSIGATSVFYTPSDGDRIPISTDGATFKMRQFSELTLTLVSNHLSGTVYDVFIFDNSGVLTIGTGPAWNSSAAGSSNRGVGAGTSSLQKLHGLNVNAVSITLRNGSTTYSVASGEATYVGSIFIDTSAGQVTCHRSYGQNRKWGIWNAYNRVLIIMKAGDSTSSWAYNSAAIRPSNNTSANSLTVFTGLAEEMFDISFVQMNQWISGSGNASATIQSGIGWNATNGFSGLSPAVGKQLVGFTSLNIEDMNVAAYIVPPTIGPNNAFCLENVPSESGSSVNFLGTEGNMILTAKYWG